MTTKTITDCPPLAIQSANDDYSRFALEQEGWGIVAYVENQSDFPRFPQMLAASAEMLQTLRAIANDCEDYLNDDLDMDCGELCQAFLAAINRVHDKIVGEASPESVGVAD